MLMCLHCAHTTLVLRLHDERHATAGRSTTSAPTPGPRREKYTTATHGTPRMAAVPSRCPCPSHPAVTRPDPAEPVQLCSNTAARIALETPEPVSTPASPAAPSATPPAAFWQRIDLHRG